MEATNRCEDLSLMSHKLVCFLCTTLHYYSMSLFVYMQKLNLDCALLLSTQLAWSIHWWGNRDSCVCQNIHYEPHASFPLMCDCVWNLIQEHVQWMLSAYYFSPACNSCIKGLDWGTVESYKPYWIDSIKPLNIHLMTSLHRTYNSTVAYYT